MEGIWIRQLTEKDAAFVSDRVHYQAFARLKEPVSQWLLLKYCEPEKELVTQCDASDGGLELLFCKFAGLYNLRTEHSHQPNGITLKLKENHLRLFPGQKYSISIPLENRFAWPQTIENHFRQASCMGDQEVQRMQMRLQSIWPAHKDSSFTISELHWSDINIQRFQSCLHLEHFILAVFVQLWFLS